MMDILAQKEKESTPFLHLLDPFGPEGMDDIMIDLFTLHWI